tara:strand:+ start:407 stop:544 length:138 start_codon:yes stop_codon:yes gene_type:complete
MTNVVAMIIMLTSPLSIFPFEQCEKFSASMQLRHVGDQQIFIGAI